VSELREAIRSRALECGFDVVGFASAEANPEDAHNLRRYLAEGRHGDMAWMARTAERRADPKALWPEARSIICLGVNYGPAEDPRRVHGEAERGAISVYARGRDYHEVLKKRLKRFAGWLAQTHGCAVKVFVDTAAVMEKPLAMRAGLGWIGKHTNLVSRRFGSWLFLGEVFTTLELPADPPEVDHCGTCDACLRACPTGALPEPYRIEPRRCISYLTIEHEGAIAPEIARAFDNRIYGCDDCLAACPWNKFAVPTPHTALQARADLLAPKLAELTDLDEASFRTRFSGTAVKRSGRDRMVRNVRIAVDNAHSKCRS
jgi:epoxyqueuosine reductase